MDKEALTFDAPPTALLEGAVGWSYETTSDGPDRWKPTAWLIVYPHNLLWVNYETKIAYKTRILHPVS